MRATPGILAGLAAIGAAYGQNLVPNPGFEEGSQAPSSWNLPADASGSWSTAAHSGSKAVALRGTGKMSAEWRSSELRLSPGALYEFSCFARVAPGTSGGTPLFGTTRVHRDFGFTEDWQCYSYIFVVPGHGASDYVRAGQWEVKGEIFFDDVQLHPVLATHESTDAGIELGEGESVRAGSYRFHPDFAWRGANYHRPLTRNRAGFNSNRWLFSPGAEVVYRHQIGKVAQATGRVRVQINYHTGGELVVQASKDASEWTTIGSFDGKRRGGWTTIPAALFPADAIWIRLTCAGANAGLQVDTYEYEARLDRQLPDCEGATRFLSVSHADPQLSVTLDRLSLREAEGRCEIQITLSNTSPKTINASVQTAQGTSTLLNLAPNGTQTATLSAEFAEPDLHRVQVSARAENQLLWSGETEMRTGFLSDRRFGYALQGNESLAVWWCESGWKVGRERGLPVEPAIVPIRPVHVSAARGEYEAVQVVLRPSRPGELLAARVDLNPTPGKPAPATCQVDEVAYVYVNHPTDSTCQRGWYPDPLPHLKTPLALRPGQNQPLWLTFHVLRETPGGDYAGTLTLESSLGNLQVPLTLHVYNFELPHKTHLRSALGLGAGAINQYHRLKTAADRQAVYEKYLQNFAEHRITPYAFHTHAPIDVRFTGEGTNKQARVDFTRFDAAARRWLDQAGFTTFMLPLRGMGGGTFHSRHLGELEGFKEGTPEHARLFRDYLGQIESHLRRNGWVDRAYTYWFDEPDPKDYEFVTAGMKRLKNAAPGIKRLLTEQPEPALAGEVDIWCALTPEWTPEKVRARKAAGEEVWWYICTGPKAPYLTEFIDHPGTELRLWPWQSWQYGVEGLLIWETVYWNSDLAYPGPARQDPWADPMSWVTGYGNPVGYKAPWGNGDGRFLYPPRGAMPGEAESILEGPVNSMRWENLRDGIEDYEYLWLLQQALASSSDDERGLLKVPPEISRDLTHFTTDPRVILAHRDRLARAIERVSRVKSGFSGR
jgi:hypothetical protein